MGDRTPGSCEDCNRPAGLYKVHDHVWLEAWPTYKEDKRERNRKYKGTGEAWRAWCLLCLTCLERRLGRRLTLKDFPMHVPVNDGIYFGYALAKEDL